MYFGKWPLSQNLTYYNKEIYNPFITFLFEVVNLQAPSYMSYCLKNILHDNPSKHTRSSEAAFSVDASQLHSYKGLFTPTMMTVTITVKI